MPHERPSVYFPNREIEELRMAAVSLGEGLRIPSVIDRECYAIGAGIYAYTDVLKKVGFSNMWQVTEVLPSQFMDRFKNLAMSFAGDSALLYAFVDYVVDDLKSDVALFLPPNNVKQGMRGLGYTTDEYERCLKDFEDRYEHFHLIDGLFQVSPKRLENYVLLNGLVLSN